MLKNGMIKKDTVDLFNGKFTVKRTAPHDELFPDIRAGPSAARRAGYIIPSDEAATKSEARLSANTALHRLGSTSRRERRLSPHVP